jgi:hypothetical protein
MTQRDDEFVEAVVASVTDLIAASERGRRVEMIGALNQQLAVLVEHRDARPGDEALRRAVARLG